MRYGQQKAWLGIALLVAVSGLSPAARADGVTEFEPGWQIRFYAASIDFDSIGGYSSSSRPGYDLDLGFGFGFNGEYRFSPHLGLDLGILGGAAVDVAFNEVGTGEWAWTQYETLTFTPVTAGMAVHLTPDKNVDLYVCPMLAWIHYGGLVVHSHHGWSATTIDFKEDVAFGLALGLGVPFGQRERWSFAANLSYLESGLESEGSGSGRISGDYDATILGLGFGYRF